MADPFITVDELSDFRQREVNSFDPLAIIAVEAACDVIRAEAGQALDLVTDDVIQVNTDGETDCILLPEGPVVDVTEVLDPNDNVLEEDTDYVVDLELGAVWKKSTRTNFARARQGYTITYSHGYDTDEFPPALKALALTVAARIYDQGPVSQETVGGVMQIYSAGEALSLTKNEKSLLEMLVGVAHR